MRWLDVITQLGAGAWVGAMAGFAAIAPLIFRAFGADRQAAGDLAGQMIWRLNLLGAALGAIALAALLPRLGIPVNRWRAGLLAVALALAAFGALYIFPQMSRAQPPRPIQEYSADDPVRVAYNRWHQRSRQVFGGAIVLGAAAVMLGAYAREE